MISNRDVTTKDTMTEYDKLIRDNIPDIIEKSGKRCETRNVSGEELYRYLDKKLDEEIAEFRESRNPEEIADIIEVLFALSTFIGKTEEEILKIRDHKRDERGGFKKGIVLIRS